jgi:hypothetical protein
MNRVPSVVCYAAIAVLVLLGATRLPAQNPTPTPQAQAQTPSPTPAAQEPEEEDRNPFAPEPAQPLPPGMTGSDVNDPPGLYNAGETAMGMKHLTLVKKPAAFQLATNNPDDPKVQKILGQLNSPNLAKIPAPMRLVIAQLAFANSDLAFQGNHLFQGNFYGVNIFDIANPAKTTLVTSLVCPGGQGDVSVYKNLLFMSVEQPNGRLDCGTQGFPPDPAPANEPKPKKRPVPSAQKDRFRGVRIFDISDIRNPKQVAAVQTCRGSHTHTLVVDPNDKDNVYIYVSGTSFVRRPEELAGCSGVEEPEKDPNTALFRIDVIKGPDRRDERPDEWRHSWQEGPGEAEGDEPMPRYHCLFSDRIGGRGMLRKWNFA